MVASTKSYVLVVEGSFRTLETFWWIQHFPEYSESTSHEISWIFFNKEYHQTGSSTKPSTVHLHVKQLKVPEIFWWRKPLLSSQDKPSYRKNHDTSDKHPLESLVPISVLWIETAWCGPGTGISEGDGCPGTEEDTMAEEPKRPEFRWRRTLGGFLDKASFLKGNWLVFWGGNYWSLSSTKSVDVPWSLTKTAGALGCLRNFYL